MRRTALACGLLTAALALSACSGSGDDDRPGGGDRTASNAPGRSTGPAATERPSSSATAQPTSPDERPTAAHTPVETTPAPPKRWQPSPGVAWQWQLDGEVTPSVDVPVYDIDGFENTAADVARLHRAGRKAICYINVGAWENYRPDKNAFPKSVLGAGNGWAGERWLDIRRLDVLRPIMEHRFDMCRTKGFDAVEPDLVEGYANKTGFPLTAADQLAYNRMIADIAHERGLAVGLKNDLPQIPQLLSHFDFAVNEECAQYDECGQLRPFTAADKAVFHVEYEVPNSKFCAESRKLKLSSMSKKLDLGVWRQPC